MQYRSPLASEAPTPRRGSRARNLAAGGSLVIAALVLGGGLAAADLTRILAARSVQPQVLQHVVQRQLQALAHENAGEAFALADVALRTQFGTAEAFLATVRAEYPMLMHPASVLYLKPESDGSIAMQKVRLTDVDGAAWSLTYLLNRTGDQWKISGCVVTPEGRQVLT